MAGKSDAEIAQLKKIQRELVAVRDNTSTRGWFWKGILQGAGAIIGSAIAVVALSWVLSLIGVIPGFAQIAAYLGGIFSNIRH